jgi:hypothetical protein
VSAPEPRSLAEWLLDAWASPAAGCPPPESWLAEEQAALAPDERERLRAHLASCPACRAESELAAAFDAGEAAADGGEVATLVAALRGEERNAPARPVVSLDERRRARQARWLRLAAAAMVALGIGLAFQTLRAPAPTVPPESGVMRGGALEALAPVGEVAALPGELRWEGGEEARSYRVRLESAAGDPIWQAEVAAGAPGMTASIALPVETRAELRRAVTYRWTVQALDAEGRVVAASEAVPFRAAPGPEPPAIPTPNGDLQP